MDIIDFKKKLVNRIANDCIANMSDDIKLKFSGNPNPYDFHFGYGLYIRNHYIYNRDYPPIELSEAERLYLAGQADDISSDIIKRIVMNIIQRISV